jgi:hypothetical protein
MMFFFDNLETIFVTGMIVNEHYLITVADDCRLRFYEIESSEYILIYLLTNFNLFINKL